MRLLTMSRCLLFVVSFVVLFTPHLYAQCTVARYEVLSTTRIGIRCNEDVSGLPADPSSSIGAAVVTTVAGSGTPLNGVVSKIADNNQWVQVTLAPPGLLAGATDYKLSMTIGAGAAIASTFTTASAYTVIPPKSPNLQKEFRFQSNVAIQQNGTCSFSATSAYATSHLIPFQTCGLLPSVIGGTASIEAVGQVKLVLRDQPELQISPDQLRGFTDAFGATPSIAKTARIAAIKPPSSKDVSNYYFNLTFLGATGSSPAFTIDVKVTPKIVPGLHKGFEINPFVGAANTGQGSISSAKFVDTIDLGSNVARSFEPHNLIEAWVFTPGFNAETDKAFDTWNALGAIDAKFNLKGLYHPQTRGRLLRLNELITSDSTRNFTIDDVPMFYQSWGFVLEAHAVLETGKKIGDSTVQNSDKTSSMTLPEFKILRSGIQLHGIVQFRRASVDCLTTGRYLVATEQSVLEHKDKSLYLHKFHGAKAYQVITGAYQVDNVGHWAVSVTYDNGFNPPMYGRANSVQVGLLVKY